MLEREVIKGHRFIYARAMVRTPDSSLIHLKRLTKKSRKNVHEIIYNVYQ